MTEHTPEATKAADLKTTLVMAALDVVEHTKEREFAVRIPCTPLEVCVRPIEEKPQRRANDALPAEPLDWGDAADAAAPSYRQLNSGDLMKRLEGYGFRCESGPLKNCEDWRALRTAVLDRAPEIAAHPAADQQAEVPLWDGNGEPLNQAAEDFEKREYQKKVAGTADQQAAGSVEAAGQTVGPWRDGAPPKPYSEEWFIARTIHGERVVLRALPEEYSYDFKTADETYIKRENIAQWMQFPDGEYIAPEVASIKPWSERLTDFMKASADEVSNAKSDEISDLRNALFAALDSRAQPVSQPVDADLLTEVADVLAEQNWRGDLVERLRDAAKGQPVSQPVAAGEVPNFRALTAENVQAWDQQCADSRPAGGVTDIPTEAMLNAARDWSVKKYGIGIGNDAATGCWQAMRAAATLAASAPAAADQTEQAARYLELKAETYIRDNASTEHDTGDVVWHYGDAGRDYYNTLMELADEIRLLKPAASAALPGAAAVPDGWKLVPVNPTGVMMDCGASNLPVGAANTWTAAECYRAMLAAAPAAPTTKEG